MTLFHSFKGLKKPLNSPDHITVENQSPTDSILAKAKILFFKELQANLSELPSSENWDHLSVEERQREVRRFHTLKGGGGFFGMSELVAVCNSIEKSLLEAPFLPCPQDLKRFHELADALLSEVF